MPNPSHLDSSGPNPLSVARLTSTTPAAVAVLLLKGVLAQGTIDRFWIPHRGSSTLQQNRIRYGLWKAPERHVGESVVVCLTSHEQYEVHCHGGRAASERILEDLMQCGAHFLGEEETVAATLECTAHDRIATEAILDLPYASTAPVAKVLLDQWRGGLRREIEQAIYAIEQNNVLESQRCLRELMARSHFGAHLLEPWKVAILGPPNVGKSSLINRWMGFERAIVHETPGTTRDVVQETISLEGWPIALSDTAGIRDSLDPIEQAGVEAALDRSKAADLVLELVAPDQPRLAIDWNAIDRLVVCSKSDLQQEWPLEEEERATALRISALDGSGMDRLERAILERLIPSNWKPGVGVPFRPRHSHGLEEALSALQLQNRPRAIEVLASLLE